MKQILKSDEPTAFIDWKRTNQVQISEKITDDKSGEVIWGILPSSPSNQNLENDYSKTLLRESLVKEQYYLCCYCNTAIKGEALDTKIEHFLPKERYKNQIFEYGNLFAACNGGERVKPIKLCCDTYKSNNDPSEKNIISPLNLDIDGHFAY